MLSLGRKAGEYIMIGDDIKVMVIDAENGLRLAVEAPREIPILRGEVYEKNLQVSAASKPSEKKKSPKPTKQAAI